MGDFIEICRRSLKVNADKRNGMVLSGNKGLEKDLCGWGYDQGKYQSSNTTDVLWMN